MTYPKAYLYRRIVMAKLYIDRHFSEPVNLDAIADEASFSKYHFIRLFKDIYGQTPHLYLRRVRIEEAKRMLKAGETVTETCQAVGFESLSTFSGLFKRMTGSTPSEFAERHKQREHRLSNAPLTFIPGCYAEKKGWK